MEIIAKCIPLKKFGKYVLFGSFLMFFLSIISFAQQRTVTGTVTSNSDGLPLPGANIVILGTAIGTITDSEGHYSLDIPDGDVSLQYSFIGFAFLVIPVGTSSVIDVDLEPGVTALDEVVVTYLGITKKKKQITKTRLSCLGV